MGTSNKQQIPVLAGAWTKPSSTREKPQLIGSKCRSCGEVYFPKRTKKLCPHCQKEALEDIKLSRRGKLDTFTVVMQQPGGGYYYGPVPYAIGMIELPEGVYIETPLKVDKFKDLALGIEMELMIEKIWEDPSGNELIGFKFRPI
mgnify:CR=1 FL=1